MKKPVLFFFIVLLVMPAAGRDIDLDRIYIDSNYPRYGKFIDTRLEAYRRSGARFIDRKTVFVHWLSSNTIIYLKEFAAVTIVYKYNLKNSSRREIARLAGTVTTSSLTGDRRFLVCKILHTGRSSVPAASLSIINCSNGKIRNMKSYFPFRDYSHTPAGDGIIIEEKAGFSRFYAETGSKSLLLPRHLYSHSLNNRTPRILLPSPDGLKKLVIAGSGGSYRSILIAEGKTIRAETITSSQEVSWIDNEHYIYRSGYAGNYSVRIKNIRHKKTTTLLKNTLNSGISVSRESGQIAFLDNQVIVLFRLKTKRSLMTCLEGDEISFNPSGSHFAALLYGRCFIVKQTTLLRRLEDLKTQTRILRRLYGNIITSRQYYKNDYSDTYCRKKIQSYSRCLIP